MGWSLNLGFQGKETRSLVKGRILEPLASITEQFNSLALGSFLWKGTPNLEDKFAM